MHTCTLTRNNNDSTKNYLHHSGMVWRHPGIRWRHDTIDDVTCIYDNWTLGSRVNRNYIENFLINKILKHKCFAKPNTNCYKFGIEKSRFPGFECHLFSQSNCSTHSHSYTLNIDIDPIFIPLLLDTIACCHGIMGSSSKTSVLILRWSLVMHRISTVRPCHSMNTYIYHRFVS